MDDITDRLRALADNHDKYGPYDHSADPYLLREAAAEIEQLRSQLAARDRDIADWLDKLAGCLVKQQELALQMAADNLRTGAYRKDKGGE